jgi:uncharacterized protein (TIGR02996 family)
MTEEDTFIRAIQAAPDDDAPKLVYADWLEEFGEPAKGIALRRSVYGKTEWTTSGRMTGKQFSAGIVGQDDDNDYDESGWVAVVVGDRAYLGHYGHCSCYGTWESLCGGGVSDYFQENEEMQPTWDWVGTPDELVEMARRLADPALPSRTAMEADRDYDHLCMMYKQVVEWDESGRKVKQS